MVAIEYGILYTNLLISYLLQYKYLHFIEILDEIIEEIYKIC